jgi:hypothetical protein
MVQKQRENGEHYRNSLNAYFDELLFSHPVPLPKTARNAQPSVMHPASEVDDDRASGEHLNSTDCAAISYGLNRHAC